MASQVMKGPKSGNAVGFFGLTRMTTVESQTKSICSSNLGSSFASLNNGMFQNAKNALIAEYITLGFDDEANLAMSDAAVLAYGLALHKYSGVAAQQLASGAAMGAYAGYLGHDGCCGLDHDAIVAAAVMGAIAAYESTSGLQALDVQQAWNDMLTLGLAS